MQRTILLSIGAAAFAVTAQPAAAEKLCSARDAFLEQLSENYAERPAAMGMASNGNVLEVLTSDEGTWTLIVTQPNGLSCVLAAGEAWETMPHLAMKPQA